MREPTAHQAYRACTQHHKSGKNNSIIIILKKRGYFLCLFVCLFLDTHIYLERRTLVLAFHFMRGKTETFS